MPREGIVPGTIARKSIPRGERERILQDVAVRLREFGELLFAYAFGSFVEDRDAGDVDIAVSVDPGRIEGLDPLDLELALVDAVERLSGLPADVVVLNDAPLGLRMSAIHGRLLFSRDEDRRLSFVERTALDAMDTDYLRRQSLKDLLTAGASR